MLVVMREAEEMQKSATRSSCVEQASMPAAGGSMRHWAEQNSSSDCLAWEF